MLIRTGILMTPVSDEAARLAVERRLRGAIPGVQMRQEKSIGGPRRLIEEILRRWCDEDELDLVVTIGGTLPAPGPSAKELMPEATLAVVERLLPGLPEEMRASARDVTDLALIDRSVAGIRGRSLILNLPAGAAAAVLFLDAVLVLIEPILAHLQERADAPQLANVVGAQIDLPTPGATNEPEASTDVSNSHQLRADEFAAFLAGRKQNHEG